MFKDKKAIRKLSLQEIQEHIKKGDLSINDMKLVFKQFRTTIDLMKQAIPAGKIFELTKQQAEK